MKLSSGKAIRNRRRGFTLLEISISLALLGLIMSLGALVADSSRGLFVATNTSNRLEGSVAAVLDRIAVEIEMAVADSLQPAMTGFVTDANQVSMQQIEGIVNGNVVLGDVLTIAYRQDPNDPVDGLDNDGDRLVDEGHLILIRDDGGDNPQTVTICRNVSRLLEGEVAGGGDENENGATDESGFLIQRDGELITLQLTLISSNENGQVTSRTSRTAVRLRN